MSGQNVQRNYTLKLGTLQETINIVDDGRDPRPSTFKERPAPKPVECVVVGCRRTTSCLRRSYGTLLPRIR